MFIAIYSDPFVEGTTPLFLGSISNAVLSDLAKPLKQDSII
tara:strand:- start:20 stop:142 length:123 start_codon:yes stop_codon:yes gene_type:complete